MATPDAVLRVLLTILGLGIACNNTQSHILNSTHAAGWPRGGCGAWPTYDG